MLYAFLKMIMKITVKVFFRSVSIRNKELIPAKGPLLVLVNHPSTFMDPIVVATMLEREVFFLAKGSLFNNGFSKWLLPKLNIIPVYRQHDDPSLMGKNEATFVKCFEHLEKGGVLLMFPEGISITERKLRPIKTGAARIALGAEARNNFNLNVQIVNIGLNYANPHKFNRDLFINIEKPIHVGVYKNEYLKNDFNTVEQLTEDIKTQLEALIIAIEDERIDKLVNNIELLYKYKLSKEQGISVKNKDAHFTLTKAILEAVNYFQKHNPEKVDAMEMRINEYLNNLVRIGLTDTDIAKNKNNDSFFVSNLKAFAIIILGLPLFVYGFINNILPFEIPARIAKKISSSIEFVGAIGMVGGLFTFSIFYSIQIALVWKYSNHVWLTIAYGISLPISGFFAYWYYNTLNKIKTKWMLIMLFYRKSVFISNLISEREQIISELDKIKKEYASSINNNQL
jgi:glycerol-3-phosphate O-acyltransferase/dihydroxyacetone phosphate acyltransferase